MALTKIGSIGINTGIQFAGVTTVSTLNASDNVLSVGGTVNFAGNVSIAGTLTYEDVTNVDSVGLITARNGVIVGSGITLSKDGDIFATGVTTSTTFVGNLTGNVTGNVTGNATSADTVDTTSSNNDATHYLTFVDSSGSQSGETLRTYTNLRVNPSTGTLTASSFAGDGSSLTGLAAGGAFIKGVVGVTTLTPVGIETSTVTRKDLIGPAGNTSTGAGSSFHGAYMGDGFLSFNTEFSNPTGYYISTFTNALVAGPMQLGTTLTIDGNFTIV